MQQQPTDKRDQEIDVLYVIRRIKNTIGRFFAGIIWIFRFSAKNAWRLLIFIILAAGIFALLYYSKRGYYASSMTIAHSRVDNGYCEELVGNLNRSLDRRDNPGLSENLGVSTDIARLVRKISFVPLNKSLAKRFTDSVNVMLPFKVEAEVYDVSILDSLEQGIFRYLENCDFARIRKELEINFLNLTEDRVKNEIREIDSLKRVVAQAINPRATGNGLIFGEPVDPITVYKRAMEMFEENLRVKKRLTLINSFEIVVGFNKSNTRADLPLIIYLLLGTVIGYVAGMLYLVPRQITRQA